MKSGFVPLKYSRYRVLSIAIPKVENACPRAELIHDAMLLATVGLFLHGIC